MPIGIELEPPVADAPSVPPVAADYADHLPLKFSSRSLVWVAALPFLAWVAELVVAPDMPTFYLLPMVALEALVLPLCLGSNGLADMAGYSHAESAPYPEDFEGTAQGWHPALSYALEQGVSQSGTDRDSRVG